MRSGHRVLLCEDESGLRTVLDIALKRAGYLVTACASLELALSALEEHAPFSLVLTDLNLPDGSGMTLLERARGQSPHTQVVMITAHATTEQAVEAMRKGAYDYLRKPFTNEELLATLDKALEKSSLLDENITLKRQLAGVDRIGGLYARSASMKRVLEVVRRAAHAPVSVLLTGESGTGKEMVARALHVASPRNHKPFIILNCGAIPESLIESELFGHEKGAFTGASEAKQGLFRAAAGGTIFLDEIGELPLAMQVKLLRVLQERAVRPVGGTQELEVDVRVVAATNRDLETEVAEQRFRQDLFYRLNVVRVSLPPLRERREDIPMLARIFLEKHSQSQQRTLHFSPAALAWLHQHPLNGNVRELENLVERAVTLALGPELGPEDFVAMSEVPRAQDATLPTELPPEGLDLEHTLATYERSLLEQALTRAAGNRTQAAASLALSLRSMRYRLAKYGMNAGENDTPE